MPILALLPISFNYEKPRLLAIIAKYVLAISEYEDWPVKIEIIASNG